VHTHPILVIDGLTFLRYVPIPVIVPAVPMPAQSTLIWGSCASSCGPVHLTWEPQFCQAGSVRDGKGRVDSTYQIVDVLIRVMCIVSLLCQIVGAVDTSTMIGGLGL
jgi:hypothetical protein